MVFEELKELKEMFRDWIGTRWGTVVSIEKYVIGPQLWAIVTLWRGLCIAVGG